MKRMWIVAIVMGAVVSLWPGAVMAQEDAAVGTEPAPWLRLAEERGGAVVRLEVAVREFQHADPSRPSVTMAGAVHIGEREYYDTLQKILDAHDVVLFEGVGGERRERTTEAAKVAAEAEGAPAIEETGGEPASQQPRQGQGLQQQLADALGLVFQLKAMDHSAPHWRNSDMSVGELRDRFRESEVNADGLLTMLDGSSMMARFSGVLLGMLGRSEQSQAILKVALIDTLSQADRIFEQLPAGMGAMMAVLVEDRNEVVLADLKRLFEEEPVVTSVGIIYGAGHLPHMTSRLTRDMGYAVADVQWLQVMHVDAEEAGIPPAQLRMMRQMIQRSIERQIEQSRDAASDREP